MVGFGECIDNPFKQRDDTDVIIKVGEETLYVHSEILSFQSPVFKEMLQNKSCAIYEIFMDNKSVKNVILFLKFLYPDREARMSRHIDFKEFLALCKEYHIEWLKEKLEAFLVSDEVFLDKTMWSFSVGLALANDFHLEKLKNHIETGIVSYCRRAYREMKPKAQYKNYRDKPRESQTEIKTFPYKEVLYLSRYYNLPKVKEYVEDVLVENPLYVKEVKENYGVNSLGMVAGLVLAEKYNLQRLRETFISSKFTDEDKDFEDIELISGFEILTTNTVFILVKKIIVSHFDETFKRKEEKAGAINFALQILYDRKSENNKVGKIVEEELITKILASEYSDEAEDSEATEHSSEEENSDEAEDSDEAEVLCEALTKRNPFTEKHGTDIIMKVGELNLHLHSTVLSYCSPVFKTMLQTHFKQENTREIELKDKNSQHVIGLMEFFYQQDTQNENPTDFDGLLSLCREYQVEWLTHKLECILMKSHIDVIDRLLMAEKYGLKQLLKILVEQNKQILRLTRNVKFSELSTNTIYKLARNGIVTNLWKKQPTLIAFLDNLFGEKN